MINVNNNFNVIPWYSALEQQNHRKWYAFDKQWPLIMPNTRFLPFQFVVPSAPDSISAITVHSEDGNVTRNLGITPVAIPNTEKGYCVIMLYPGQCDFGAVLPVGRYYATLTIDGTTLYSEVFTAVDDISRYLKVTYWNTDTLYYKNGEINYGNDFQYEMYLDSTVGKPEYEFSEELTTRLGYKFLESQISNKLYKFTFLAPEFICDAMRLIRLSDYIKIEGSHDSYNAISFSYEPSWETQGDLAAVEVSFETDTIIQKLPSFNRNQRENFYNALLSSTAEPLLYDEGVVAQYYTAFSDAITGKLTRQLAEADVEEITENTVIPIDQGLGAAQQVKLLPLLQRYATKAGRDYSDLESMVSTHVSNGDIHITAEERKLWTAQSSFWDRVNAGTEEAPVYCLTPKPYVVGAEQLIDVSIQSKKYLVGSTEVTEVDDGADKYIRIVGNLVIDGYISFGGPGDSGENAGVTSLEALIDVGIGKVTPLKDGHSLVYDETLDLWVNKAVTGLDETALKSYLTNNKYATQDYVSTQIANLVGSAPETLDTIYEIADQIQKNVGVLDVLTQSITTNTNNIKGLTERVVNLEKMWFFDPDNEDSIRTAYNVIVEKAISFGGVGTPSENPGVTYLNNLLDVSAESPNVDDVLAWDGTYWVNKKITTGLDIDAMWTVLSAVDSSRIIDISHIPDLSSKYLSLSGGTLFNATERVLLALDTNNSFGPNLQLRVKGVDIGSIGHIPSTESSNYGLFISNTEANVGILLGSDRKVWITEDTVNLPKTYEVIHTGNIGSHKAGNASRLNGYTEDYFAKYTNTLYLDGSTYRHLGYGRVTQGFPSGGGAIVAGDSGGDYALVLFGRNGVFNFNTLENGVLTGWKTVAFTDSNVASATKLQTARTIWGQSFDGSADISNAQIIIYKNPLGYIGGWSRNVRALDSANNIIGQFGFWGNGDVLDYAYIGKSYSSPWFLVNSSGNVLIGPTIDNGYKLDVAGTGRFTDTLTIGATPITEKTQNSTKYLEIDGNLVVTGAISFGGLGESTSSGGGINIEGLWQELTTPNTSRIIDVTHIPDLSGKYLSLSGGTMTGNINITHPSQSGVALGSVGAVYYNEAAEETVLYNGGTGYGAIKVKNGVNYPIFRYNYADYPIIHSGNIGSQRVQRAKYLDTLMADGSGWYDNQYVVYGQWAADNGSILDWKVDNYSVRVDIAKRLNATGTYTAWGQTFFESGVPKSISGADIRLIEGTIFWHDDIANYYIKSPVGSSGGYFEYKAYSGHRFLGGNVLIGATTDRGHKLAVIRENAAMTATTLHNSALFIGSSNSIDSYGLNLWTEGSGNGFIQQGRTDDEQPTLYSLILQPFGGYVGVGNASPVYRLDVAGTLNATTIRQGGTAIGSLAFKNSLVASDIPSLDWSKITTGKPTTLSGYGIKNAFRSIRDTNVDVTNTTTDLYGYWGAMSTHHGINSFYHHILNLDWNNDLDNWISQLAIPTGYSSLTKDASIYYRNRHSSTWSNWVKVLDSNNVAPSLSAGTGNNTKITVGGVSSEYKIAYAQDCYDAQWAVSAGKLYGSGYTGINLGSSTQPVYFSDGVPVACTSYADANTRRTKYVETLAANGTAWYGNSYMVYGQWATDNGSILDWKVDNYSVRVDIAKKLNVARKIFGVEFNGEADVSGIGQFGSPTNRGLQVGVGSNAIDGTNNGSVNGNNAIYLNYYSTGTVSLCYGGGNVAIGVTSSVSGAKLYVSGNIVATGGITFGSDERYKTKLSDATISLEDIANAPLFNYRWNDREDSKVHLGTTAQYWNKTAFRNAVCPNDEKLWTMSYSEIAMGNTIVLARELLPIKREVSKIEKLENRVSKLERILREHNINFD